MSDNKTKTVWNIINSERQKKQLDDCPLFMYINNKLEEDPLKIAEHLNNFFSKSADSTLEGNREQFQNLKISYECIRSVCNHSQLMNITPTDENEVLAVIQSLKPKLSCGIDDIPPKVVTYCAKQLACPLVSIINKSFTYSQFPSALKISKIYPKHKKGETTKAENFRPISLLSTFSKIIEKITLLRMLQYLENHNLITKNQHGFLKGRSTITAINSLVESVTDQLENHKYVSAVLLDYSKAFDCLGHNLILQKLSTLGIQGKANDWVASYLKGRKQTVEVKKQIKGRIQVFRSKLLPIKRGVPQGSVLGPFLFVLFTNDFPALFMNQTVKPIMYADDTTLLLSNDSVQELHTNILHSTNKTLNYCLQNDLAINPKKTTQVNFSRRRGLCPEIPDITVQQHTKLLGITIDANLSWTDHIDTLAKKLNSGIFAVRRMKWIGSPEIAKTVYYALVESHIRYGITAWGGTSDANMQKILTLQKKAIRSLADLKPLDSCREAYKQLRILTVVALYIYEVILYTDKEDLIRSGDIHNYRTRRMADYHLPAHHTTQYSRKPTYMGRKLFNKLPSALKSLNGEKLKKHLKEWLVQRPVYSVREYLDLETTNSL